MKVISRSIGKPDTVLADISGTLIIESGDAIFMIREVNPTRLVVLCPQTDPGETVYRMLIEPVSMQAFQVTQWVIPFKDEEVKP